MFKLKNIQVMNNLNKSQIQISIVVIDIKESVKTFFFYLKKYSIELLYTMQ